jgi:putative flavoprotein involved in K+ transport
MQYKDTIIVGSGQAGLAVSYYLTKHGHSHVILEQADHPAAAWRKRSWDSFTLVTPVSAFRMPGTGKENREPGRFMPLKEIREFFEEYVIRFKLPILCNTLAESIEITNDKNYLIKTDKGLFKASNVVVATGFFQQPRLPAFAKNISPDIKQIHSSEYRNPGSTPDGAVLIVGSGQSGTQLAEELNSSGRKVFLSTGTAGRAPRRYRGKDIIDWLEIVGMFNLTPEQLPPGMSKFEGIPHLSGTQGGHTINLHQFAHEGITLLGHIRAASGYKISIAPDLYENLKKIDEFETELTNMIDEYIAMHNLDVPPEQIKKLNDGYEQKIIEELDLEKEGINCIIWAVGYKFDYSLVKLPVVDQDGFPIQDSGITKYPGLFFAGMPWMPSERSGFLLGIGDAAKTIADRIVMV